MIFKFIPRHTKIDVSLLFIIPSKALTNKQFVNYRSNFVNILLEWVLSLNPIQCANPSCIKPVMNENLLDDCRCVLDSKFLN